VAAIDLPFVLGPWEPAVDPAALVAELDAKAARDNAHGDQLQAELDELRRQRQPVELTPAARTPAITHWIKTGEQRSGTSVIDLSDPVDEEEAPGVIDLANPSPEVRDELADAREFAQRWAQEQGA